MTRATICAQYFLQTIANSHSGNLMVDMTETMVERRISELELRYSAVNEQIARFERFVAEG